MKNKSLLITNIVLALLVIIFFSEIESTFLHITHQWTISKAFPYFLLIISGTYFALFSLKTLSKNKLITFFVSFLSFSSPFILGFALNPIYQGDFSKDDKKFKKAGIEIVGISKDDVTSHRKFCDKMNIPYILLADVETEVCKKFGV